MGTGIQFILNQPQNFSVPSGYDEVITFSVDPAITDTLMGCTVWWRAYPQKFSIPIDSPILIEKSSPADITLLDSPLSFYFTLATADTLDLVGNYYHEATILNGVQEMIGTSFGIMTVTATINRTLP